MSRNRQAVRRRSRGRAPAADAAKAAARVFFLENLALGLFSGILLGLPFLFPALSWIHWIALTPWVILLTRPQAKATWALFLVGAYAFSIMAWGPFSATHRSAPFLISLFFMPLMLPFALLLRRIALRFAIPLVLLVPMTWIIAEWLRTRFSVGQIGMYQLGSSQAGHLHLIQTADVAGIAGVSFLVAAASGALADIWKRQWRRASVVIFALFLGGAYLYGVWRVNQSHFSSGPRLALIQPNLTHYRDARRVDEVFEKHLQFTRVEIAPRSAELVVWPENALGRPFSDNRSYLAALKGLVQSLDMPLLLGSLSRSSDPHLMNTSAIHISRSGDVVGRYDKIYLIPWAEYMPFEHWLPRVSRMLHRAHHALSRMVLGFISAGAPGKDIHLFSVDRFGRTFHFAVPICFEITSAEFGRRAAGAGAEFLVNITSEGVLGPSVYAQSWALATFRAVENRLGVVRAGNNGISGFIDPAGRTHRVLRGKRTGRIFLEEGTLIGAAVIDPERLRTFYTKFGDFLVFICLAVTLALVALSFTQRWRRIPRSTTAESGTRTRSPAD